MDTCYRHEIYPGDTLSAAASKATSRLNDLCIEAADIIRFQALSAEEHGYLVLLVYLDRPDYLRHRKELEAAAGAVAEAVRSDDDLAVAALAFEEASPSPAPRQDAKEPPQ